jgi:hypothetical protein
MTVIAPDTDVLAREIPGIGVLTFNEPTHRYVLERDPVPCDQCEDGRIPGKTAKGRKCPACDGTGTITERVRLDSVTGILGCLAKPALLGWYEAGGAAGVARLFERGELWIGPGGKLSRPAEEAIDLVRLHKLGADAARDESAARGLDVHTVLEDWAKTGEAPDPGVFPPEQRGYVRGLIRALLALDPEPLVVERITCHPELMYAGRLDLRARINGRDVLVDLKTNKGGRSYLEGHIQAAAYVMAEVALGEPEPDGTLIVAVGEDGSFEAMEGVARPEHFEAVLRCHRALGEVRRPLDAARRAAAKAVAA